MAAIDRVVHDSHLSHKIRVCTNSRKDGGIDNGETEAAQKKLGKARSEKNVTRAIMFSLSYIQEYLLEKQSPAQREADG